MPLNLHLPQSRVKLTKEMITNPLPQCHLDTVTPAWVTSASAFPTSQIQLLPEIQGQLRLWGDAGGFRVTPHRLRSPSEPH